MSRLTTIKINRYITAYVSECARYSAYSGLYEGNSITRFGTAFKNIALCALDKANEGQSGTNKINKQEFYCCLFCMGFPLGLIAKTLLNANLAPVRNAVMKYKNQVIVYLKNQISESFVTYFSNSIENIRIDATNVFLQNIVNYCGFVGGLGLIDKLIGALDVQSLFLSVNEIGFKNPFARGGATVQLSTLRSLWERSNGSRRGQVRRTGLTTSRVAQATTQIPATPNAAQGVTPSAIPQAQNISQPTPARTPVRDIDFASNIGVEIEVVVSKGISERELTNSLVREMRAAKIDVNAVGYTHDTTTYWKITSDASINPVGVEVVSPILKGKRGLAELKKCIGAIRRAGGSVNKSVGIHVHFGANGLELDHFKNILYNYAGFEPIINKTLYESRRNSRWAQLVSNIPDLTNKIDRSNSFDELATNVFGGDPYNYRGGARYYTVNFMAYRRHGTLEFRQLQGSVEEDTIIYWVYWLHFLIEASKRKRLSFFDEKQVRNITPVWLSTWLGNRSFDLSGENFNA
jgi:hypothetical protein